MPVEIDQIINLAREAGQAILAIYNRDFSVTEKDDRSPLTEADLASHRHIVAGLQALTPDLPILSEESADIPYATRRQWQRYWLVDPLDGTKEFIKRNGEFTVNIALIADGVPVLGVVHVPVSGTTYAGQAGRGAFREDPTGARVPLQVTAERQRPLRVVGSRSHAGESLLAFLQRVGDHEIVSMGSSLKLCLVADGSADIYPRLGPTSEWDTAAAQAVVEAAGGQVTDTRLQPLRYNRKESLLNPHFLVFGDAGEDWAAYLEQPAEAGP
jgi:3'(2'), 5'-bisphosphate nucleotidase